MANSRPANILHRFRQLIDLRTATTGDGEMLTRFVRERDQEAFTALVERHGGMVLGVCRRVLHDEHLAEDAFQATFLVLARKAPGLRQYGSLGNWLHAVAYHLALRMRAQTARRRALERPVTDMPQPPAVADAWAELRPVLDAEVQRLPARYRQVVVLCYLEGKTNEAAAQALAWPVGTVKSRLARARELLRSRLARRGLSAAPALLGPALAEQANAAVPAALLRSTSAAAGLFGVGNTVAAAALAARSVVIAQGALRSMFANQCKVVLLWMVVLGALGTGSLLSQDLKLCPAGAGQKNHPPVNPLPVVVNLVAPEAPPEPPAEALPPPANAAVRVDPPARVVPIRRQLAQLITLEVDVNTPLKDAIDRIVEKTKIPLVIDSKAFEAIGVQKVEEQPVALPKMTNIRLSTALELLTKQVKGDIYTGAFRVRGDHIEVTTNYVVNSIAGAQPVDHPALRNLDPEPNSPAEIWTDPTRRMTTVIAVDVERRPLGEALRDLSEQAGYQLIIDPRVGDKVQTPVTLALDSVWFDTAVGLLIEPADLDWVWVDNIIYVTSKESAKQRRERQRAREEERVRMLREAAALKEAGLPNRTEVLPEVPPDQPANADKQPLHRVLADAARAGGLKVVIDPRVGDKAGTLVPDGLPGVAPATAVRLLADMAGLRATTMDKVIYVTTVENARGLEGNR